MSIEAIGRVSSASVKKGTGKNWEQWIALLTKLGAQNWTHQEIVAYLKKRHRLTPWWQQGVTHGFEVHTGRRIDGQNQKGQYATTSTRTFSVDSKKLWSILASQEGISVWLNPMSDFNLVPGHKFEVEGGIFGEVRTMKRFVRVRMTWQDTDWERPTVLQLYVVPRGKEKSILVFQHDQIKDLRSKEKIKAHWKDILKKVGELVSGNS